MRRQRRNNDRAKNVKQALARLLKYTLKYIPVIIMSLVFAAVSTVLQVLGPDKIADITGEIRIGMASSINMTAIWNTTFILIAFYATSLILGFIQNYVMAIVTARISKSMRADISRKINVLPFKYFDKATHGDVLSRVTNDVDTISQTLNQSVSQLVSAIVMLVGSVIMMFITNWIMALTAIGASLFGFIFMALTMAKSQKYFQMQQDSLGAVNGHIEEIYTNHNVVKVYNGGKEAKQTFSKFNEELRVSGWKSQFISGLMMPMMSFIGNLGYVAVSVVGAVLTMKNIINFEVIVAFMIYVRLFTQPLSQIAQGMQSIQSGAAASERVFEFLDEAELEDESLKQNKLANIKGHVEFKNVKFGYDDEKIIIKDFSANILPGQKVAIVGPTGAGKTTLVNLLMRFYELNAGSILIDDTNIKDVTRENVHDQFGMVLQDAWIFEGTIFDNVIYSQQNILEEDVINACKTVGLHHFIRTLPDGYNTKLDDKVSLSEGQKQLLTIARALVQNAPLLILDEATSSVDTRTEVLIQKAMDELTKGRTSFVIAHRLSTIKNADIILVMKNGDIVESGNHDYLINKNGFYADLYNSQFQTV